MIENKTDSFRFYTIRDLGIFQTSRQTYEERSAIFYDEKRFISYLYTCIPPYGWHRLLSNNTFRVDFERV